MEKASALLWLISADNGTIPQSDLNFLQKLDLTDKKLYIVINKADLKPQSELEEIAEEVLEALADEDIEIAGLCVYSSIHRQEHTHEMQALHDFLFSYDVESATYHEIMAKLKTVESMYTEAIAQVIKEKKRHKTNLQKLKSKVAQIDISAECDAAVESIEQMLRDKTIRTDEEEQNQNTLASVMEKFRLSVDIIFNK